MDFNILNTKMIFFTRKNNSVRSKYCVTDFLIWCSDFVRYLDVMLMLGSKFNSRCHVCFVHRRAVITLGIIPCISPVIIFLYVLYLLYDAFVTSKLESALVIWNNRIFTNTKEGSSICVIVL
jgi:hypothetical protein